MTEKWSDADMARFLDAYQNYDVLWNPQTELYRNLQARRAAVQAILQHMNKPKMSENDLKNKIKNIRTTYNRELNKVLKSLKSGSGPDDLYVPVLIWFKHADSFLRTVTMGGRKSQSNMNSQNLSQQMEDFKVTSQQIEDVAETNSQEGIDDTNEEDTSQDRSQPHLFLNISPRETHQHLPSTSATKTTTEIALSTPKIGLIGKKQKSKIREVFNTSSVDRALSKLEEISKSSNVEDEFATFGKHIASQLRQLPLQRALEIEQQFQNTLTQERLKYLSLTTLPTYHIESFSKHTTASSDYHSSDTQFSKVCSPPPQFPAHTTAIPDMSTSDLLAAALASIRNENDHYP